MNSEMMAKLRGLIEEAANGKCNMTAEGKSCPVHENEQCPGYVEENIKPAGISDELAAKKIAAKIAGTPGLNIPKIKQYVTKYLSMVGKAPTDVDHLAALVSTELENKGVMESNAKPDFLDLDKDGNKKEPIAQAAKDAKAGKKSTDKKGGMSAKQAKYFGKKTVKESQPGSLRHYLDNPDADASGTEHADLLNLMHKYGYHPNPVTPGKAAPSTGTYTAGTKVPVSPVKPAKNKSGDILGARNPGDVANYPDDYKNMRAGTSQDAQRMNALYKARGPKGVLPEDEASDQRFAPQPGSLRHYLDNPDVDASGTEHEDLLNLMHKYGHYPNPVTPGKAAPSTGTYTAGTKVPVSPVKPAKNKSGDILGARNPGDVANYPDEYKYMRTGTSQDAQRMNNLYKARSPKSALPEDEKTSQRPAPQPGSLRHYLDNPDADPTGTEHEDLLNLMHKYGYHDKKTSDVDENVHITVDGAEAQDMINRLMALAGQEVMPTVDDHADMCDDCGCASADCTCNKMTPASFGPDGVSMEENIDHDFGHTAHSDMGEPVDPDTYMYKAPVGNQRIVKGTLGDNPLIKEDADALGAKLKKDYKRYVAEAELARSNAGDLSPLSKDNREKFDIDPFAGDTPVTDGSRSPLSTVKRQKINK